MAETALSLEPQLDAAAAEDDAWLRAKAKSRYQGVAPDGDGGWCATIHQVLRRPGEPDRLGCVWFPGATAAEALAKARRWVEGKLPGKETSRG